MTEHLVQPGRLTWGVIRQIGQRIRPEDAQECLHGGHTPEMAMMAALGETETEIGGEAIAAFNGTRPIGAFGWTGAGNIWSLWTPLSRAECLSILRQTPTWVAAMVARSGHPSLSNAVWSMNEKAIAWLRAAGCFAIDPQPELRGNHLYHHFETRHDILRGYLRKCEAERQLAA